MDDILNRAERSSTLPGESSGPPSWWRGEEHAYQQGIALIGNLGQLTQGAV